MKKKLRQTISIMLALIMAVAFVQLPTLNARAATRLSGTPNANIEYGYTTSVQCGTIRYVNQRAGSGYYYSAYWGGKNAREGCAAACVSMALSYVGINRTPAQCSDGNAYAYWKGSYDGAQELNHYNTSLQTMINNYLNGNGKYSPPIVWLGRYGTSNWHYDHIIICNGTNWSYN